MIYRDSIRKFRYERKQRNLNRLTAEFNSVTEEQKGNLRKHNSASNVFAESSKAEAVGPATGVLLIDLIYRRGGQRWALCSTRWILT